MNKTVIPNIKVVNESDNEEYDVWLDSNNRPFLLMKDAACLLKWDEEKLEHIMKNESVEKINFAYYKIGLAKDDPLYVSIYMIKELAIFCTDEITRSSFMHFYFDVASAIQKYKIAKEKPQLKPLDEIYFEQLQREIKIIREDERDVFNAALRLFEKCSYDFSKDKEVKKTFDSFVQNKFHVAITGMTAAEVIRERIDSSSPTLGLTSWKDGPNKKPTLKDACIGKNYLTKSELSEMKSFVDVFFQYAEDFAKAQKPQKMLDWYETINNFFENRNKKILLDKGTFHHDEAVELAREKYAEYLKNMEDGIFEGAKLNENKLK